MRLINVTKVRLATNPAKFSDTIKFVISFETPSPIKEGKDRHFFTSALYHIEIEWKIIYIGCVNDSKYDQVLEAFTMGPLERGLQQFEVEVPHRPFPR